jgi:hypothetical protein
MPYSKDKEFQLIKKKEKKSFGLFDIERKKIVTL